MKVKKGNESFSDELLRLVNRKGKISDCAGLWSWMSDREAEEIKKSIEKRRALSRVAKRE